MKGLEHLMQPIRVKNLTIPNRVVLPPMGTVLTNSDGSVGERLLAFFERRVMSGAGFVINEITSVHPKGSTFPASWQPLTTVTSRDLRKWLRWPTATAAR